MPNARRVENPSGRGESSSNCSVLESKREREGRETGAGLCEIDSGRIFSSTRFISTILSVWIQIQSVQYSKSATYLPPQYMISKLGEFSQVGTRNHELMACMVASTL